MSPANRAPERGARATSTNPSLLYLAAIDFPSVKARAIQITHTSHALARAGCNVTLVVGRRQGGPIEQELAEYGLQAHPNLRLVRVPALRLPPNTPTRVRGAYTRLWSWSYLIGCLALLPSLVRPAPTAVLLRDYRLAWILSRLRQLHQLPIVFEVHGLPSAELLDQQSPTAGVQREARRRRGLEELVFSRAWRLLTITDCLRARLIEDYGVPTERVFTVPDASRAAMGKTVENLADPPPARRRLIYAGQVYPWKGVDQLIRAMTELPEAELWIVGGLDDDPNLPALRRLAAELGVQGAVRFLRALPYEQIPALLAQAEVALLPLGDGLVARCFTSPLKLFDYLAAGLPIVAIDFPTVREVLRHEDNALIVPRNDPGALASAIRRLLDDASLAARLGAQARRDAAEYTWDRRAERILAALRSERCRAGLPEPPTPSDEVSIGASSGRRG